RGRTVSVLLSSVPRSSVTCGRSGRLQLGNGSPRLSFAARSMVMSDLPTPGLPSKSASRPRGRYGSQSQRTQSRRTCESGSDVSGDMAAPPSQCNVQLYTISGSKANPGARSPSFGQGRQLPGTRAPRIGSRSPKTVSGDLGDLGDLAR